MRIKTPYLLAGILAFAFISCQKEESVELPNNSPGNNSGNGSNSGSGGSSSGSEIGTWNFVGMHTTSSQAVEYKIGSDAIKEVSTSDYITENNTGTLKFDGTNCTITGIGYSLNTNATYTEYTNGAIDTTFQYPMTVTVPATNGSAQYKKIGSDSLYFQSGAISTVGSGGTVQSTASGYKLRYFGADSMTMTYAYDDVELTVVTGISTKTTTHAGIVLSLKKQ
jgi:hypothetical protein